MSGDTIRAVSVGGKRAKERLLQAVNLAALDCGASPSTALAIAMRTWELVETDGYALTRQVGRK